MKQKNCVILNADDFGMSPEINHVIVKCFEYGWISSTTLLTNLPGFTDAVEKVHASEFIRGKVGIHINLTEGQSLSEAIRKQKKFCNGSGTFIYNRKQRLFWLTGEEKKAVYLEIKAQIDRALKHGIVPTHIDSHHHVHYEWSISKIMTVVLKEYGIKKIRICRNTGMGSGLSKTLFKRLLNIYLRKKGFELTDFFGDLDDFNFSLGQRPFTNKIAEIMVHPRPGAKTEILDLDEKILGDKIKPVLEKFRMIGYADI
jgi:hypothetical protein